MYRVYAEFVKFYGEDWGHGVDEQYFISKENAINCAKDLIRCMDADTIRVMNELTGEVVWSND